MNRIDTLLSEIESRIISNDCSENSALESGSQAALYMAHDPLLDALYQEYLEAQRIYLLELKAHGVDSPMSEVACDAADSAYSAYQTRFEELRGCRRLAWKIAAAQKRQRQEYNKECRAAARKKQKEYEDEENFLAWFAVMLSAFSLNPYGLVHQRLTDTVFPQAAA